MKTAALCILGEIWLFAATAHYILPVGWVKEWYGFPLYLTGFAIIMVTANYFINRTLIKPKKD